MADSSTQPLPQQGGGFLKTLGIVVLVAVAASAITAWLVVAWLFPRPFTPVKLDQQEQAALDTKLKTLDTSVRQPAAPAPARHAEPLQPERYSEAGASHEITFTEREINAMIATNTDLADKLAIDLSPGMISGKLLLPLDPEMPVFGGKTLKVSAGIDLHYKNGRPAVILRGVSVWGVPIPNAWLGDLKNIDLVAQYGDKGFWKAFSEGVDDIEIGDDKLTIKLKE